MELHCDSVFHVNPQCGAHSNPVRANLVEMWFAGRGMLPRCVISLFNCKQPEISHFSHTNLNLQFGRFSHLVHTEYNRYKNVQLPQRFFNNKKTDRCILISLKKNNGLLCSLYVFSLTSAFLFCVDSMATIWSLWCHWIHWILILFFTKFYVILMPIKNNRIPILNSMISNIFDYKCIQKQK